MVTEVWFAQDIAQPIEVQHCKGVVFTNDSNGNKIGVRLFNGTAAYAPGGSVTCYVIRPDGVTVNFDGTVSNNALSATLPATALTVPGQISVVLQSVSGSTLTTVFKGVFGCEQGTTGTIVAPSVNVSTLAQLTQDVSALQSGKLNKSGGVVTGDIVRQGNGWPAIYFKDANGNNLAAIIYATGSHRFYFREFTSNGQTRDFRFPSAWDETTGGYWDINVTKV